MTWILGSEQNVNQCGEEKDILLKKSKFLSEFRTKSEKKKVLENLGISGVTSWGQIDGFIENQTDLWTKFVELFQKINSLSNDTTINLDEFKEQLNTELEELKEQVQQLADTKINKEINGDTATSQIAYTNDAYPDMKTLQDALDKLLYYDLEVSFSCSPSTAELHSTVTSITYTWSYNKTNITSVTFDGNSIDASITTMTIYGSFSSDVTKSLVVSDGNSTVTKSASLRFYPGIYYGAGTELDMSSFSYKLQSSLSTSITVNATDDSNTYIWICTPTSYGTPTFTVNGFEGGFTLVNDDYQYNKYGTPVSYQIWRSDNGGLGSTTITIS